MKELIALALLTLLSLKSQALDQSGKRKTVVTFEDQLIVGEVRVSEFFYFLEEKRPGFGSLIKLRENFLPEVRRTSENLERRSRGD